jgi:L-ascorbate metabolism protein UlaG (beta-lactamase superfamily)
MPNDRLNPPNPPLFFVFKFLFTSILDLFTPIKKVTREDLLINSNEIRVWALGHATTLINFYGTTILTDPMLFNWLPFPRRMVEAPYAPKDLPQIDYLVISHAHMDHFHRKSLSKLSQKTATIVLPKNCQDLIEGMGFKNIVEIGWGEALNGDIAIRVTRPQHWGTRVPWEKMKRGYNAYIIEKKDKTIFFAGDTGYNPVFKELGKAYKITLAILPIGAYNEPPTFRKYHMTPEDAVKALTDLNAEHMIPIHWGTFRLSLESLDDPPTRLKASSKREGVEDKVHLLKNGQSFTV